MAISIAESHSKRVIVEVLCEGVVQTEIPIIDGSISLDGSAASRGRVSLTIPAETEWVPTSPTSLLAPYGNELRVAVGIELANRFEMVRQGIFRIDRSTVANDGATITIDGLDRSAGFIDNPWQDPGQVSAGSDAAGVILLVLLGIDPDLAYDADAFDAAPAAPVPLLQYETAEDRWAFCQGLAESIGCDLYLNRDGEVTIRVRALTGNSVATLAEGEGGVLLGIQRDWDRTEVYNRVIVTGENTSNTGTPPRGVAEDRNPASPTYYQGGTFGKKPYFYASEFVTTTEQAFDTANGILARVTGAPDIINFETISDASLQPGDAVHIEREQLGIAETHIIDTLEIPLGVEGTMSGTTRAVQEL